MLFRTKQDEYLARAEDADREAGRATAQDIQDRWKRIAEEYRALAEFAGRSKPARRF